MKITFSKEVKTKKKMKTFETSQLKKKKVKHSQEKQKI